jgi:hypothetical protein
MMTETADALADVFWRIEGAPEERRADMDLGLKGKRALVTGSTAGIGFATARA